MPSILFYISGHGYGHATRAVEVINALAKQRRDLYFHIKSGAPRWIFDLNVKAPHTLYAKKIDVGAVQKTSFHIDKTATLLEWQNFLHKKTALVRHHTEFVRRQQISLILSDISPLAFDIARETGTAALAIGNFSWDWIFRQYVDEIPGFAEVVEAIRESYQKAHLLLRLPMHGDLSIFPKIKDIPLIARKAVRPKSEVYRLLGLAEKNRPTLVLVAFRAADIASANLERAFASEDFLFITFGATASLKNSLNVPPDFMRFAELVNACDIVVSKPGYGLVSEIIANRTPLLYTSRDDFAEYDVLVQGLKQYAVCEFMPRHDFLAGDWQPYLQKLRGAHAAWPEVVINGAEKAAAEALAFL